MNLYEINENLKRAIEQAENDAQLFEGVVSDTLFDDIDSLEIALEEKQIQVFRAIKNADADICGIDAEIKRLQSRKKTCENIRDRIRAWFSLSIPKTGTKNSTFSAYWKNTTAIVYDEAFDAMLLPEEMRVISAKPIASELKKAIEAGASFDNVSVVQNSSLVIR